MFRHRTERKSFMPDWRRYLRFRGADVEADIDDELRFHLDMRAAELEAHGLSPDEACRAAHARFGDVGRVRSWLRAHDRQRLRRAGRAESMDALLLDLRYAVRTLRQRPAFTASVVLVLALGIGAATAMFSAVDAALLRPLPFQRDDRLVTLHGINIPLRESVNTKHMPDIGDARAMPDVFTHVAAYAPGGLNLAGAGEPVRTRVALVTTDFFATLGVRVAQGRGFTAEEGTPDGPRVAILSDGLWRRQFGADPGVVGRDVRLNEVTHRVVGIMPPDFVFPEDTDLWLPLTVPTTFRRWEAFRQYMPDRVVARLAPDVTRAQAGDRIEALIRRYQSPDRAARPLERSPVQPFRDVLVGKRRTALLVLMGATTLVLLVACANVTNLLLARAATRQGEMALRAALGGALLGVSIAHASLGALSALLPSTLAPTAPLRVDLRVLGFTTVVALVTGLGFGLWPALGASRADASETMKGSGVVGGVTMRSGAHARGVFVVAELALALVLAVGAGLMLRSLQALLAADVGVRPERVATLELSLARQTYGGPEQRRRFFDDVLARLRAAPDVEAAALVTQLPLRGGGVALSVAAEGRPRRDGDPPRMAEDISVSADYFRAVGIPLVRGRTFAATPDSSGAREVIVNQRLARLLWPGEDPIGRRLVVTSTDTLPVVGIVGDVRAWSLEELQPQMYRPIAVVQQPNVALLARGAAEPGVLARWLLDAV
ncbi:MAG TPA: ABC transporter permease, partial [Gemmatimonadaceae bacterium]|nr:ABC transporter permease [Gemmatimonadaceae bacterium]